MKNIFYSRPPNKGKYPKQRHQGMRYSQRVFAEQKKRQYQHRINRQMDETGGKPLRSPALPVPLEPLTFQNELAAPVDDHFIIKTYPNNTAKHSNLTLRISFVCLLLLAHIQASFAQTSESAITVLNFANRQHDQLLNSPMRICNKEKLSIVTRTPSGKTRMQGATSLIKEYRNCAEEMAALREKIRTQRPQIDDRPVLSDLHESCHYDAITAFLSAQKLYAHTATLSRKHQIAQCGELSHAVVSAFLDCSDTDLTQNHQVAIVYLEAEQGPENHAFNLFFARGKAPKPYELRGLRLSELAHRYPSALMVDLWNHLIMPLGDFNRPEHFAAAIQSSLRHIIQKSAGLTRKLEEPEAQEALGHRYLEDTRRYYTGLANVSIKLIASPPTEQCRPSYSR
jgi:hypothetical protein